MPSSRAGPREKGLRWARQLCDMLTTKCKQLRQKECVLLSILPCGFVCVVHLNSRVKGYLVNLVASRTDFTKCL